MMLTDLASVLRAAGLKVEEVAGWKTRGHGQMVTAETIVCHHTAGPAKGNYPSLGTVRDGRTGLAGPLAQLGLGRDGTVYVIAAGVCYHAGVVFEKYQDNWHAIGIEAEATGTDPWPSAQYAAYAKLCAVLRKRYGIPNGRVLGHKEVAKPKGRKPDPNFDMDAFRATVAREYTKLLTPQQEDGMSAADADRVIKQVNAVSAHLALNTAQNRQILFRDLANLIKQTESGQTDQVLAYIRQVDAANDAEITRLQGKVDALPKGDGLSADAG